MRMKRNSRNKSETIERMLLSRDITRLRSEDQYLHQQHIIIIIIIIIVVVVVVVVVIVIIIVIIINILLKSDWNVAK